MYLGIDFLPKELKYSNYPSTKEFSTLRKSTNTNRT